MTEKKASVELQNLADTLVKQAIEEGFNATELENLIRETRTKAGLTNRIPNRENLYREPTEEELSFREKCYEFFQKEITIEEATSRELKMQGHTMCPHAFQHYLENAANVMLAAKMLTNDGEKITNQKMRDILWSAGTYPNYSALLSDVGYISSILRRIAETKGRNFSWPRFYVGHRTSHSYVVLNGYIEFLKQNNIF